MDALFLWFWHVITFLLPSLGLATLMFFVLRVRGSALARTQPRRVWGSLLLANFAISIVGVAVTGLDGAMLTYGAMVLVSGVVSASFAKR